jgi:hypothetical protein
MGRAKHHEHKPQYFQQNQVIAVMLNAGNVCAELFVEYNKTYDLMSLFFFKVTLHRLIVAKKAVLLICLPYSNLKSAGTPAKRTKSALAKT